VMSGYGTSPASQLVDPIHVEQSWFSLGLYPVCPTKLTPVDQGSWGRIKELFR